MTLASASRTSTHTWTVRTTDVAAFAPPPLPVWLVSIPTTASDGRQGVQLFAVPASSAHDAIGLATLRAATAGSAARRRGAALDLDRPATVRPAGGL
ncbi:hypothetical protein [Kitasatospora arboriphila]